MKEEAKCVSRTCWKCGSTHMINADMLHHFCITCGAPLIKTPLKFIEFGRNEIKHFWKFWCKTFIAIGGVFTFIVVISNIFIVKWFPDIRLEDTIPYFKGTAFIVISLIMIVFVGYLIKRWYIMYSKE